MPHYTLEGKVNEETLRVVFSCIRLFSIFKPKSLPKAENYFIYSGGEFIEILYASPKKD